MHTSQNFSTCTHLISCAKRDSYLVHLTLSHLLAADQVVGILAVEGIRVPLGLFWVLHSKIDTGIMMVTVVRCIPVWPVVVD
jgi:hypothetical protein